MACAHCCFACTEKGTDMSRETWLTSLDLSVKREEIVTIGGGEPTLHPLFWEFIGLAFSKYSRWWPEMPLFIVTNGSQTESALALAEMARKGIMGVALSQDQWHDPIHHSVPEAFEKQMRNTSSMEWQRDLREIRSVRTIVGFGRARSWGIKSECACDGLHVDPNGKLWSCGCKKLQFGTVFDPDVAPEYERGDCWRVTKKAIKDNLRAEVEPELELQLT